MMRFSSFILLLLLSTLVTCCHAGQFLRAKAGAATVAVPHPPRRSLQTKLFVNQQVAATSASNQQQEVEIQGFSVFSSEPQFHQLHRFSDTQLYSTPEVTGATLGKLDGFCIGNDTLLQPPGAAESRPAHCSWTFTFENGNMVVGVKAGRIDGKTYSVLGGTGDFASATGTVTTRTLENGVTEFSLDVASLRA